MANGWKRNGPTRKSRLPADWPRLRKAVLERCGHQCQWVENGVRCLNTATDVDHIVEGADDHYSAGALQGLCNPHHLVKTGRAARARQLRFKELARLPEEKQPGLIEGTPTPTEHKGF